MKKRKFYLYGTKSSVAIQWTDFPSTSKWIRDKWPREGSQNRKRNIFSLSVSFFERLKNTDGLQHLDTSNSSIFFTKILRYREFFNYFCTPSKSCHYLSCTGNINVAPSGKFFFSFFSQSFTSILRCVGAGSGGEGG